MNTVAAISTAIGEAGIGVIRLTGKDSLSIASKIFKGVKNKELKTVENKKLTYGHIIDNYDNNSIVDEVLIAYMKGPYTYTREDMVEIYSHGGIIPVKKILELLLKNGADLAEPGEFTKRAFLNGRIDLSQAEAVIDIINSKTEKSLEMSVKQLDGNLSKKISKLTDLLMDMRAQIEASIDFPEEDDVEKIAYEDILENAIKVKNEIEILLDTSNHGKILRDGINTVILGKPNVGKSSLLNAILKEERAIVTDIPGTTRDIIEEFVNIDGIPLKIIDTAGIRETDDLVEKIGVDLAKEKINESDLIIAIFDMSRELTEEDMDIIRLIKDKVSIVLLNKIDKKDRKVNIETLKEKLKGQTIIETSIIENVGIDKLIEEIKNIFYSGDVDLDSDVIINNIRHKRLLEKSLENIDSAIYDLKYNIPLDCIEIDITNCWDNLAQISGETVTEDVLDRVFSEFCIGK